MPHKADVIAALDACSADAAALGAVNCIAWEGDRLVGHSTDGAGLVASLRADHGIDPTGMRCAVLGAGGAARSVIRALGVAGASEVLVVNRTEASAVVAASLAEVGRAAAPAEVAQADLVINATSVGMGALDASGPTPLAPELLAPHQVVVDLVYQPLETPLLAAARARGCRTIDGLGMLVHQAALAVTLWTGIEPDLDAMALAARG
jgi:shikimate dehydrogenase